MFWVTYHPDQYTVEQEQQFWTNLSILKNYDIKFSVGVVATKNRIGELSKYKQVFSDMGIYMWINGLKGIAQPFYSYKEKEIILSLDPFSWHETDMIDSKGLLCSAGRSSMFIDGFGRVHRCGLDQQIMGNILYGFPHLLETDAPCELSNCSCYIAYSNLLRPQFERIYGDAISCRLPK